MMNRLEKWMTVARRVWAFIWKECAAFRAPYYSWHPEMPCVHIITTLNWAFFFSLFSFHHHHPQFFFLLLWAEEEAVLLKEVQCLSGVLGLWWVMRYQRPHCVGELWSSVRGSCGLSWFFDEALLKSVWSQREWKHDDLISSLCLSSTLLPAFYSVEHQRVCVKNTEAIPTPYFQYHKIEMSFKRSFITLYFLQSFYPEALTCLSCPPCFFLIQTVAILCFISG